MRELRIHGWGGQGSVIDDLYFPGMTRDPRDLRFILEMVAFFVSIMVLTADIILIFHYLGAW